MKKDLENRTDIELLVNSFYDKIRHNILLGYVFEEIAHVNWEKHLPKMYKFWELIIFDKTGYEGHPLRPHLALNRQHHLTPVYFETWLQLFEDTVNEYFEGEKAEEIKGKAKNIALSWSFKIDYMNQLNTEQTAV